QPSFWNYFWSRAKRPKTRELRTLVHELLSTSFRRLWTDSSIKQWHELPDDITRKDGHCDVAVTPRPAARGDSADLRARQQQQHADQQGAHVSAEKKKSVLKARKWQPGQKCHATQRQYSGDHSQAPSRQPQPVEDGESQPDDRQQNNLLGEATPLRGHADPRPQRQAESDQQDGGNNISASVCQAGMKFRQAKH